MFDFKPVDLETLKPGDIFAGEDGTTNVRVYSPDWETNPDIISVNLENGKFNTTKRDKHVTVLLIRKGVYHEQSEKI